MNHQLPVVCIMSDLHYWLKLISEAHLNFPVFTHQSPSLAWTDFYKMLLSVTLNAKYLHLGHALSTWKHLSLKKVKSEIAQSCPTLCKPMDSSPPGSSVHGIFQARILEWVAISFSRRSFQPRDWTRVSCIVGRHFTIWATREILKKGEVNWLWWWG